MGTGAVGVLLGVLSVRLLGCCCYGSWVLLLWVLGVAGAVVAMGAGCWGAVGVLSVGLLVSGCCCWGCSCYGCWVLLGVLLLWVLGVGVLLVGPLVSGCCCWGCCCYGLLSDL